MRKVHIVEPELLHCLPDGLANRFFVLRVDDAGSYFVCQFANKLFGVADVFVQVALQLLAHVHPLAVALLQRLQLGLGECLGEQVPRQEDVPALHGLSGEAVFVILLPKHLFPEVVEANRPNRQLVLGGYREIAVQQKDKPELAALKIHNLLPVVAIPEEAALDEQPNLALRQFDLGRHQFLNHFALEVEFLVPLHLCLEDVLVEHDDHGLLLEADVHLDRADHEVPAEGVPLPLDKDVAVADDADRKLVEADHHVLLLAHPQHLSALQQRLHLWLAQLSEAVVAVAEVLEVAAVLDVAEDLVGGLLVLAAGQRSAADRMHNNFNQFGRTVDNQHSSGYLRYSQIVEDCISKNRYISSSQAGLRAGASESVAGFTSLKLLTLVNLGLVEQNSQNFFSKSVIWAFCSSIVFQNCTWFSYNCCSFCYSCCYNSSSRFRSLLPSTVAQSSSIWPTLDSPPQSCPNLASIFLEIWDIWEMLMRLSLSSVAASSSAILVSLSASSFLRNYSSRSTSLRLMDSALSSSRRFSFILVEFLCRSWLKCAYQWYLRIASTTSMYFLQQYFRDSFGRASSEMARLRMFLICSPHSESCSRKVGLRQSFLRILAEGCCRASLSSRAIRVATSGSASLHFSSTASSSSLLERGSSSIAGPPQLFTIIKPIRLEQSETHLPTPFFNVRPNPKDDPVWSIVYAAYRSAHLCVSDCCVVLYKYVCVQAGSNK